LYEFADGLRTADAIEAALGVTPGQFDSQFQDFVEAELGHILDTLDQWHRTQHTMMQRFDAGDWDGAIEFAGKMIELNPGYAEPDGPYLVMASAYDKLGAEDSAMDTLEAFREHGGYEPDALKRLADWLHGQNRTGEAIDVLQDVIMVDPLDQTLHGMLGDLLLESGEAHKALQEYEVALALDPHDKATAFYRVARAHHQIGDVEQARDKLLLALDVAPGYRPAQRLLLELMRPDNKIQ
jgi:tetratricopeptide (TPR) repeat protein